MRTVLSVDTLAGVIDPATGAAPMFVKAERAGISVQEAAKISPFSLSAGQLPDWSLPGGVRERGHSVRKALYAHPGLPRILDHLALTPMGKVEPLFLKLAAGDPELIPWEALCDSDGEFLALDQRWPIGRISDPMTSNGRPPAVLQLPVRLLAVISAYGVKGQAAEWESLEKAVNEARLAGLPVALRVIVGDPDTHAAVQASIDAGMTDVALGGLDTSAPRVVQDILGWAPNVIHFFCHGHAGSTPAEQSLEFATANDVIGETGAGSVLIRRRHLTDMLQGLFNPWLMTLNCCSSGAAATDLRSLASDVVASGFPAAVAMTEPVDSRDSHEFTLAFYRALFKDLRQAGLELAKKVATAPAARVEFEFARAMHDARSAISALHGDDPANRHEWALPVLYVRGVDLLQFESAPPVNGHAADGKDAEHRLRAQLVANWLQQVRETLDEAGRLEIMTSTLADVPKPFWPDVNGGFATP